MWKYCLKKTAQVVIVMILISFFSFAIVYFAPGDISDMYVNPEMTEEQKANVIAQLGLDKSMTEQYFAWAKRAVHGDLGVSLSNKSAVWPQFMQRLPATIILMGSSMILSLLLAIPLGLWSGYKKNSWLDNLISSLAYMGMSIPSFWFGMLLIIVFAAVLKVLPSSGMHTVGNVSAFDTFQHMILPCITLSIGHVVIGTSLGVFSGYVGGKVDMFLMSFTDIFLALPSMLLMVILNTFLKPGLPTLIVVLSLFSWASVARITRAETMSLKERDFVVATQNLGASNFRVIIKHIIPNILGPVIVAASLSVANAILMESSLSFLGLGVQIPRASWGSMLQGAQAHILDYPLLAVYPGVMILITVLSFNLLGDILRNALEPKIVE